MLVAAITARGEELRGSATPGIRLHHFDPTFADDGVTSWFDQWEHVDDKAADVPFFADLMHLDFAWMRDDETALARLERWSPHDVDSLTLFDVDWRGLRVDADHHWGRIDSLRLYPRGTGQTGAGVLPALGSYYNDDTGPDDRFFVRRYGGGGTIRLRPDGFGMGADLGSITQLSFSGRHEDRTGQRQALFLLKAADAGASHENQRNRGLTEQLDQDVTTLGARVVTEPAGLFTGVIDVGWEGFREHAPIVTVGDAAAFDPAQVRPGPGLADAAIGFVPNTDRWTGSIHLSRRIQDATLHAGGFATRLTQVGRRTAPERDAGLDDNHVDTIAATAGADVPIGPWLHFDSFGSWAVRDNEIPRDTALFAPDNRTQIQPFLARLRTVDGGAELSAAPIAGTRVAAGWRIHAVDRGLRYASTVDEAGVRQPAIRSDVALVGEESQVHTFYLSSSARLLRRLRLSAEAGLDRAPKIGYPNELDRTEWVRARGSQTWVKPLPITFAAFGSWLDGSSGGLTLVSTTPDRSQQKDFHETRWDWGATLSVMPHPDWTLYATFTQQVDDQQWAQIRSNVPRYNGPQFLRFYLDSLPRWKADTQVFAIGATWQASERVDFGVDGMLTTVGLRFPGDEPTPAALRTADQRDIRISSIEASMGVRVTPQFKVGVGARTDAYSERGLLDAPNPGGREYSLLLSATIDFALPEH